MDESTLIRNPLLSMNLYIINETRRGAIFGIGTYIWELIVALKNSDINICIVYLNCDKPQIQTEETDDIQFWYIPAPIQEQRTIDSKRQSELYYRNVVYLLKLHIKEKQGLIFHLNYLPGRNFAEELKKSFDCRIISAVHFFDWAFSVFDNLPRLRRMMSEEYPDSIGISLKKTIEEEKLFYSKLDRVICISNYMQEILCMYYGLDSTKISVISNGLTDVADSITNSKMLRKKWNISSKEKIILFAGRIDEVKGVIYLISAFREVLKKMKGCRLIIAGNGNYNTCLQETKELSTKITFTGFIGKEALYELYRIADVGVVPSLFEPFGYVAVEMMMHRLPIVATSTSGLNEVVDDACGLKIPLIVQPEAVEIDTSLLAEKILYLLQNPTKAKQLGKNGRKRYLEKYSSKEFRNNMLQIYQSLI